MIRFHDVVFCEHCNNIINDDYDIEEKPIYFLDLPHIDRMFFCCEDCRDEYIKQFFAEGYIMPNGRILED